MMNEPKKNAHLLKRPLSREQQSMYSDVYKDIYGCRPRMSKEAWNEMTEWHLDLLIEDHKVAMEADWHRKQEAQMEFFREIRQALDLGAKDFGTAVAWVLHAYDCLDEEELFWTAYPAYVGSVFHKRVERRVTNAALRKMKMAEV